jgi:hypothetical protein
VSEFWKCFAKCENSAFETFEASWPNGFHALIGPMKELEMYFAIAMSPEWNEDAAHVLSRMEKFVNRFFSSLVKYQDQDITNYIARKSAKLTFQEWSLVWSSILLLSYDRNFCTSFGKEKIIFERLVQDAHQSATTPPLMAQCY